jgi:hypothetical protein
MSDTIKLVTAEMACEAFTGINWRNGDVHSERCHNLAAALNALLAPEVTRLIALATQMQKAAHIHKAHYNEKNELTRECDICHKDLADYVHLRGKVNDPDFGLVRVADVLAKVDQ